MMVAMHYDADEAIGKSYDDHDVSFMDDVMIAWAIDAHKAAVKLGYPQAGNIWGMKVPVTNRWVLDLSADQLIAVDRVIAKLPWRDFNLRCRKFVFVEYFSRQPQGIRALRFGVSRRTYARRRNELLQYIYDAVTPSIETWPQRLARRETEIVPNVE